MRSERVLGAFGTLLTTNSHLGIHRGGHVRGAGLLVHEEELPDALCVRIFFDKMREPRHILCGHAGQDIGDLNAERRLRGYAFPMKPRSKAKQRSSAKLSDAIVTVAVGGAAATLATTTAVPAVAVIAGAALANGAGSILALFQDVAANRRRARVTRWAEAMFSSPEEASAFEQDYKLRAENPDFQQLIVEGLRAIDDAIDEAVVPALGRLMGEFLTSKPDAFFRGVRRLLSDLTSGELFELEQLLQALRHPATAARIGRQTTLCCRSVPGRSDQSQGDYVVSCTYPLPPEEARARSLANDRLDLGQFPSAIRLFHLLKVNGLASEPLGGGMVFGTATGPHVADLNLAVAQRLARVMHR